MDKQEIEERVINLLVDYSKAEDNPINLDSKLDDDIGLDSLDRMEAIMRLEEEFGVKFSSLNIAFINF